MNNVEKMFASFFFILFSCVLLIFLALGVGAYYEFSGKSCENKGNMMNIKTDYSISTGCMMKMNDQWLPENQVIAVERDGKIVFVPKYPYRLEVK